MSCQKGNVVRKRPQKHQNTRVFKNDLHDTNVRTKRINQVKIVHVCDKCKAILEWKIKYKKYKLLKSPKSCNKCGERTVKQPYHIVCQSCADKLSICPKCNVPVTKNEDTQNEDGNGPTAPPEIQEGLHLTSLRTAS